MRHRTKERGFTLIELLIVMVILGLLGALVGPRLFGHTGKARQKAAKSQIAMLETAVETYKLDVGKFPTTEEGLTVLREKPSGAKKWDGPYLKKAIPSDPWGNSYEYKYPSEYGNDFDIISYGADGQPGGEKEDMDIVSWKNVGE